MLKRIASYWGVHSALVRLAKKLGYCHKSDDIKGLCFGTTLRWLEACLLNQQPQFTKRLERIAFTESDEPLLLFEHIDDLYDEINDAWQKRKNRQPLTEEEQTLIDIYAFYDSLMLYQSPKNYREIVKGAELQTHFPKVSKIASSLEEGISSCYTDISLYYEDEITEYLQILDKIAADSLNNQDLCMLLAGPTHAMGLFYSHKEKVWKVMDINQWPPIAVDNKNLQEISSVICSGLARGNSYPLILETTLLTKAPEQNSYTSLINLLEKTKKIRLENIIRNHPDDLTQLLQFAAKNGNTEVIEHCLNLIKYGTDIEKLFSIPTNHEDFFSIFLKADDETIVRLFNELPSEELNRIKSCGHILPKLENRVAYLYSPTRSKLMFFHNADYNDIAQRYAVKIPDILALKRQLLAKHAEFGTTTKFSDFMTMFYEFQFTIAKLLLIPCKSVLIEELDCLKKIIMDSQNRYISPDAKTAAETKLDKLVDIVFDLSLDFSNIEDKLNIALADKNSELNRVLNIPLPKNPSLKSEKEYISHLRHHSAEGATQPFSLNVLGSMIRILLNGSFFEQTNNDELNELSSFIVHEYIKLCDKCHKYSKLHFNPSKSESLYDEITAIISSTEQLLHAIRMHDQASLLSVDAISFCEEISTLTQSWIEKREEERRNSFGSNFRIF